jgi:lipopolysaccharide transport system ATP-binding protein
VSDFAIRVTGLGKCYRIARRGKADGLYDAVARQLRSGPERRPTVTEPMWALRDVAFTLARGKILGIIGRNGSGKTTLLKILARVTAPTEGQAEIHGRVAALLGVGTGFHPQLTGRDNIALSGAILGMRPDEVTRRFDAIVEFADIEQYLDEPVKHYSSGMYARLAFSVASHLPAEVMLVDEILAVGDIVFRRKAEALMKAHLGDGRSVVYVGHGLDVVRQICDSVMVLDHGRVVFHGPTEEAVRLYESLSLT